MIELEQIEYYNAPHPYPVAYIKSVGPHPCTPRNGGALFEVLNPYDEAVTTIVQTDWINAVTPWEVMTLLPGEARSLGCSVVVLPDGGVQTKSFFAGGCAVGGRPRWPLPKRGGPAGCLAIATMEGARRKHRFFLNRSLSTRIDVRFTWIQQGRSSFYSATVDRGGLALAAPVEGEGVELRVDSVAWSPFTSAISSLVTSQPAALISDDVAIESPDDRYAEFRNMSGATAYVRIEHGSSNGFSNVTIGVGEVHSAFVGAGGYVDFCWSRDSAPRLCDPRYRGRCYGGQIALLK